MINNGRDNRRKWPIFALFIFLLSLYLWGFRGTSHSTDEWLFVDQITLMFRYGIWAVPIQYRAYYVLGLPFLLLSRLIPTVGTYQALTLVNVLSTAVAGSVVALVLTDLGYKMEIAATVGVLFGAATQAFPYSGYLLREPSAGMWLVLSVWLAMRYHRFGEKLSLLASLCAFISASLTKRSVSVLIFPYITYLVYASYDRYNTMRVLNIFRNILWPYRIIIGATPFIAIVVILNWLIDVYIPWPSSMYKMLPNPESLVGIFISPGWGLLVFNPILVLSIIAIPFFLRRHRYDAFFVTSIAFIYTWGAATHPYWWGLWNWGPRQMNPILAFWIIPVAEILALWGHRRLVKIVFGLLLITSTMLATMQTLVAYPFYEEVLRKGISDRTFMWSLSQSPVLNHWRFLSLDRAEVAWVEEGSIRWPLFISLTICVICAGWLLVWHVRNKQARNLPLLPGFSAVLGGMTLILLGSIYQSPHYGKGTGLFEAANFLRTHARPGDGLVVFMWGEPPRAYWPRIAMLNYCKAQCPPQIEIVKENSIDSIVNWREHLWARVNSFHRVWVVTEGWPPMVYHPVEFSLVRWFYYADTWWTGPTARISRFDRCESEVHVSNVAVRIGDLIGYIVRGPDRSSLQGQCFGVELFWRFPLTQFDKSKVSLQLLNEEGNLIAQNDKQISDFVPSIVREQSLIMRMSVPIPSNLTQGTYKLILIVYNSDTLRREMLENADHLVLMSFEIR